MTEKIADHETNNPVSGAEKKPYVKPQLRNLSVATGTAKPTQNPTEASPSTGPS